MSGSNEATAPPATPLACPSESKEGLGPDHLECASAAIREHSRRFLKDSIVEAPEIQQPRGRCRGHGLVCP